MSNIDRATRTRHHILDAAWALVMEQGASASIADIAAAAGITRQSVYVHFGSRGGLVIRHRFPLDGDYELEIVLGGRRREVETLEVRVDGERIGEFVVDDESSSGPSATTELKLRFSARAGTRTVGVSFLAATSVSEGIGPSRLPPANILAGSGGPRRSVRSVQIGGPYEARGPGDTASRRQIFICRPASAAEAATVDLTERKGREAALACSSAACSSAGERAGGAR